MSSTFYYSMYLIVLSAWFAACVTSVTMVASPFWEHSSRKLKAASAIWIAVTAGNVLALCGSWPWGAFPQGFTWAWFFMSMGQAAAPTGMLWHCHRALRELHVSNNRRASTLLDHGRRQRVLVMH